MASASGCETSPAARAIRQICDTFAPKRSHFASPVPFTRKNSGRVVGSDAALPYSVASLKMMKEISDSKHKTEKLAGERVLNSTSDRAQGPLAPSAELTGAQLVVELVEERARLRVGEHVDLELRFALVVPHQRRAAAGQ